METTVTGERRLLLTKRQVAQRLGISVRTLEREIVSGSFPRPVYIRGSVRITETDIELYLLWLEEDAKKRGTGVKS